MLRIPSQAESFELISLIFFYTELDVVKNPWCTSCSLSRSLCPDFHAAHIHKTQTADVFYIYLGNQTKLPLPKFAASSANKIMSDMPHITHLGFPVDLLHQQYTHYTFFYNNPTFLISTN